MIVGKVNLTANVVPKTGPDMYRGIFFGPHGTESTDRHCIVLRVPYPKWLKLEKWPAPPFTAVDRHVTVPIADCDQIAKAVNTAATTAAKEPWKHAISVDVSEEGATLLQGVNRSGGPVSVQGQVIDAPFGETQDGVLGWGDAETDFVVNLNVDALERLLKAAKALSATGIEFRADAEETRWTEGAAGRQRKGAVRIRVLASNGTELATGGMMPMIR